MAKGGREDLPEGFEPRDAVWGKQVAALLKQFEHRVLGERVVVGPGEQMQVGECEAADRCAEEREPGGAVGWMQERAGECEEVEDLLAFAERLDLDGPVWDRAGLLEGPDDGKQVRPRLDQDGDFRRLRPAVVGAPGLDDVADGLGVPGGLFVAVGGGNAQGERVKVPGYRSEEDGGGCGGGLAGGFSGSVRDGGRLGGVAGGGEDSGEVLVEGVDKIGLGAEVRGEVQGGEGQLVQAAAMHGLDEALDPRLAKKIDGLLGVADEEDGAGGAIPATGEELDELVLGGGGVLHFVDEQMLKRGSGGGEVVLRGGGAKRGFGEQGDLGEVALAASGEDGLQLGEGAAENLEEGLGDAPLVCRVVRGRKCADAAEQLAKGVVVADLLDEVSEFLLMVLLNQKPEVVGLE